MEDLKNTLVLGAVIAAAFPIAFLAARFCLTVLVPRTSGKGAIGAEWQRPCAMMAHESDGGRSPETPYSNNSVPVAAAAWGQSFDEPARALARKIAAVLKNREAVTVSFAGVASISPSDAAAAREALERELRGLGVNIAGQSQAGVPVAVTLSENLRGVVWVAEIRRGDAREVVMEEQPRPAVSAPAASIAIEKRLVFEERQRILDLAPMGRNLLVLNAETIALYEGVDGGWRRALSVNIPVSRPWPRDLRGRVFVQSEVYEAYLPGLACNGNASGGLSITCRDEALWPLGPNAYGVMDPTRNFFFADRLVLPGGLEKRMPAFFAAASFADRGRAMWAFASTDGRTHLYSAAFDPGDWWDGWGSDIAAVTSQCDARTLLLSTGTGDETVADSVQAYEIAASVPRAVGTRSRFPALSPRYGRRVSAAWRSWCRAIWSGRYAAFRLAIPCSH